MEVSRPGEVSEERMEEEGEEVVIEMTVKVAEDEVKVVHDRRRLLVAPRVKRNKEEESKEFSSR